MSWRRSSSFDSAWAESVGGSAAWHVGASMADAGLAIVGEMQSKARPAATRTRVDWQSGDPDLLVRARRSGAILAVHADGIVKLAAAPDLVCVLPGYRPAVQHPLVTLARTVTTRSRTQLGASSSDPDVSSSTSATICAAASALTACRAIFW
jgi:hypothetical protein